MIYVDVDEHTGQPRVLVDGRRVPLNALRELLELADAGWSSRHIAGRLGLDENTVAGIRSPSVRGRLLALAEG